MGLLLTQIDQVHQLNILAYHGPLPGRHRKADRGVILPRCQNLTGSPPQSTSFFEFQNFNYKTLIKI